MKKLNAKNFGLSIGIVSVIFYFGCVLSMLILGKDGITYLSNLLFHGVDFSSIIRTDIPLSDTLLGAVATFILWAGLGYLSAFIYNKLNKDNG